MKATILLMTLVVAALAAGEARSQAANSQSSAAVSQIQQPVIVDATNKVVGLAVDGGVIVRWNGVAVLVSLTPYRRDSTGTIIPPSPTALYWNDSITAWYTNSTCSGTPVIAAQDGWSGMYRPAMVVLNGATKTLLIASTANSTLQQISSQSAQDAPPNCQPTSGTVYVFSVEGSLDLTQTYPEPLHVK